MKFPFTFLALFISAFFSNIAVADKAAQLYKTCIACHGEQGRGNEALNAPALVGQQAWYISNQLTSFKNGWRGAHPNDTLGKQMAAFSQSLSKDDITELAQYISALPTASARKTLEQSGKGYSAYQARCGACHGSDATGNDAFKAPNLTQLSQHYLARQMVNFTKGIRGTKTEDKLGRQMAMMAKAISEEELTLILEHLAK
ncbi:c-type cytochrome [Thalassotalea sp. LPB0316]|uniref:c-type cytochrome n=1 Tax=Thalassotalea sp. LPB0316 TaxID=2769490 RepID=UPI0018671438|nr:c-type cytochrome [Thalassotalea sp. LPB0316]QOL26832.1 c-type cytochrome [Thalassotalea sp. LPB0316]